MNLLELRKNKNLTQQDMAKLLNITESTVRKRMQRVRDLLE